MHSGGVLPPDESSLERNRALFRPQPIRTAVSCIGLKVFAQASWGFIDIFLFPAPR